MRSYRPCESVCSLFGEGRTDRKRAGFQMTGGIDDWKRSKRKPPTDPGLEAEAAANPGGSVAAIDGDLVGGDPNTYIPPEAIHGCWIVGPDGKLTGEYAENPQHGTPTDDFTKLTDANHFWAWLPDEPAAAVRQSVARLLDEQVPGAVLEWMKVTDTPEFVTGGRRDPEDEQYLIVVRAGVAMPFALSVRTPEGRRDILWGVFTWVASGLDKPQGQRRDRVWLDLNARIEWAKERLSQRVYRARPVLTRYPAEGARTKSSHGHCSTGGRLGSRRRACRPGPRARDRRASAACPGWAGHGRRAWRAAA